MLSETKSLQLLRTAERDRKSTRLNSSHTLISYAVFCLQKHLGRMVDVRPRQLGDVDEAVHPVDVEHLDLHRLPDLEHLGRMVDVRPRQLFYVDGAPPNLHLFPPAEVHDV